MYGSQMSIKISLRQGDNSVTKYCLTFSSTVKQIHERDHCTWHCVLKLYSVANWLPFFSTLRDIWMCVTTPTKMISKRYWQCFLFAETLLPAHFLPLQILDKIIFFANICIHIPFYMINSKYLLSISWNFELIFIYFWNLL